jgi:hypothetical protein
LHIASDLLLGVAVGVVAMPTPRTRRVMASTCVCGALAKVPRRGRSTDADDEERKETEDCAGQKDGYGESHDVRVIALLAFPVAVIRGAG